MFTSDVIRLKKEQDSLHLKLNGQGAKDTINRRLIWDEDLQWR